MMNRQQADALRRENEARNSAQYQKTQASFAASNRAAQAAHQAREAAANHRAHEQRMAEYARGGAALRETIASNQASRTASRDSYSRAGSAGKSKGGGLLFVIVVIGAIAVFGHSGSNTSGSGATQSVTSETSNSQPSNYSSSLAVPASPAPSIADQPQPAASESTASTDTSAASPGDATLPIAGTSSSEPTTADAPTSGMAATSTSARPATVPAADAPAAVTALEPVYRIGAVYPAAALQARPSGPVAIRIGVQPNGTVSEAFPESGDQLLVPAAIAAARQWRFAPYPYEPGKPVRTMRVAFEFNPPARGFYPQQPGRGFGYQSPGRGFGPPE